ncbi:FAD-binding and (Fe-S)-binding domain-containing protein [Natronolimnohabitans innermongolicus]|uniref:D-lactate dehydrogenase (cytochrome) n=1 Tax=Natronolimnohabitans innermongolicus JCM 12255 TaxID=1227499 RepID=L9WNY0_9EURY|nr:FAD-binding and (Fe-S)-binding domain-containing protein [Natronolimnohabitans innermongolicus]ELY50926.1 FAD-linked oxidase domain protein [Natronolimnohabitans innermongolicus JCM 12255]
MTASPTTSLDDTDAEPTADERADYDYVSDDVERPDLVADLRDRIDGDVRFDTYSRELYATDASAYKATPIGVVFPTSTEDVASVVSYCADREIPVLPRGGGTSLAGQAVNEAVVLDFTRYMDEIRSIDADDQRVRVQSGVILEELNDSLAPHGLKFAPDPAAGNRSVMGGAIGNNSTGAHSLVYGKTDAYVEECEVVLADGTVTTFGETDVDDLRERADPDGDLEARIAAAVVHIIDEKDGAVRDRFPNLKRNVSGYNLDVLIEEAESGSVNLARLLAGSEGTLATITEAEVSLEPVPETKAVSLLFYESVLEAVTDVQHVLEHDPAAVELIDDVLIGLARETAEFEEIAALVPDDAQAALLVEFYAEDDDHGREQTAGLLADRIPKSESAVEAPDDHPEIDETLGFEGLEAHAEADREQFWKLRKAGLPILLSRTSNEKHISFIEDCAIPPEHLPEFVDRFQELLADLDRDVDAAFYAHAGPGVLHVRPLVNTKAAEDRDDMVTIADEVTDMVVEFGGSVSGEHGDGRARTQWNRKLYGEDLWQTFRDLKTAFDPDWLLNPGNVCGDHDMTEHLRYDELYDHDAGFDSELNWRNENGMQGMVELCHGCGGCRGEQETTGGVMCPTYRAAEEEITSTRGRANLLRNAMSGDLPDDPTDDEFVDEVLDLCIGCKGCARDCPSEVDMAKLKTEVMHERHQQHGSSLRDKLFANFDRLAPIGSAFAPLSNIATSLPGAGTIAEKTVGVARERSLPEFHRETFQDWFEARGGSRILETEAERKAVVFADTYTNYSHPEVGKAAVRVLEAAGVHVDVSRRTDSGRPPLSKGFIDKARDAMRANVAELAPRVDDGWDVVVAEPSDAVMFQSDSLDLLGGVGVESVAANSYGVCEYLDTFRLDENVDWAAPEDSVAYHGHCHQKATKKDHHAVGVLRRAGYAVDPLDSGCCGMAGSFGYEAEHYSLSQSIGDILVDQIEDSAATVVTAPGNSCRTQLGDKRLEPVPTGSSLAGSDLDRDDPPTPIELLAYAL